MGHAALSWRRLGAIALAVLALHALLLRTVRDALGALAPGAPSRPAAALQVRTLVPAGADATIVAPAAVAAPMALGSPAPAQRPAAPRDAAPATRRAPASATLGDPPAAEASAPAAIVAAVGVAAAGEPASSGWGELPVYRTNLPPAFAFGFELTRGAAIGSAELRWQPQADRYQARLVGKLGASSWLALESTGGFDDAGIAPERHTDRRRDRGTQAANFRRAEGRITFSGPAVEHPLPPGAQDRLSWMLQLAAVGAAEPSLVGPGGRVSLLVVGARGDADVWTFVHRGEETLTLPDGPTATVRLLREPARAWDTRAEVWLAPARHYLPVRARLSNAADREALLLVLREVLQPP